MGSHGMKIVIYNLWHTNDDETELDFESDPQDICVFGVQERKGMASTEQHVANRLRTALCEALEKAVAKGEARLNLKKPNLEAELRSKRKALAEEIERKMREWELKEMDLKNQEDAVSDKEYELNNRSRTATEKEK